MWSALESISPLKIMARSEIAQILAHLSRGSKQHPNRIMNRIVFRLATCCGLRCCEVVGLNMGDVRIDRARPHIRIRAEATKRTIIIKGSMNGNGKYRKKGKTRIIPLWWDRDTMHDLVIWRDLRRKMGADVDDPFVCRLQEGGLDPQPEIGGRISLTAAWRRFKTAIKCLGPERRAELSIHTGRHSFCSHAIAGGRDLVEVRDAAGHSSIMMTGRYLHVVPDDKDEPGDLFKFRQV